MTMTESDLLSLRQAVAEGLFVSIDAARKAAHRDPRFPEPVAKQGDAFLYNAGALRAYRPSIGRRPDLPVIPFPSAPAATEDREWLPMPGAGYYEASHRGKIRSVDRTKAGRFYKGVALKLREDGDGYLVFNYTDDEGVRHHNVSVARTVLLTHDPEGYRPGLHACHGPGGQKDNRWPENIRWDTPDANRQEALEARLASNPPKVKPPKTCPRCKKEHRDKGLNCHPCVVKLGVDGAILLLSGMPLDKAAEQLRYPAAGLFNLACRYGGLRLSIARDNTPSPAPPKPWLRRVLSGREASRRNSDRA